MPPVSDATTLTVEPKPDTPSFGVEPSITKTNIGGGIETPRLETQGLTTLGLAPAPTTAPQIDRLNPIKIAADAIPDNIAVGQLTLGQGRLIAATNASLIKSNITENAKLKYTAENLNDNLRTMANLMNVPFKEVKLTGRETPAQIQLIGEAALTSYTQQVTESGALTRITAKPPTAAMLKLEQEKRDTRANRAIVETLVAIDMRPGNPGFDKAFQKAEDDYNANRKGEGDQGENFPSASKVAELMNDPDVKGGLSQPIIDVLREQGIRPENATGEQIGEVRATLKQDELDKIAQLAQSEADVQAIRKIAPLLTAVERLQGLAQGLLTDSNWLFRMGKGVYNTVQTFIQSTPDARLYAAQYEAFGILIAKAVLNERLSNQEGQAFVRMLPQPGGFFPNSLESGNILFADMKSLLIDSIGPTAAKLIKRGEGSDKDKQDRFNRFKRAAEQRRKKRK